MTIKDLVYEIQEKVYNAKGLMPDEASELLQQSSALYGNVLGEIRKTSFEYSKILQQARRDTKNGTDARITAETSQEWMNKKEAEDLGKLLKELIASLKYTMRALEDERIHAKNI